PHRPEQHQQADQAPSAPSTPGPDRPVAPRRRPRAAATGLLRWVVALTGAMVVFGLFIGLRGEEPVAALQAIWESAAGDTDALGETFVRAAPLLLGALAVVVPARAGLF